jgi:hypothetical protein
MELVFPTSDNADGTALVKAGIRDLLAVLKRIEIWGTVSFE